MSDAANDDGADLFEKIEREHGLAPPGDYVAELMVATTFLTTRTAGVEAVIKIVEGEHKDRLLRIRFMESGPASCDSLIHRNAMVLKAWLIELGVTERMPASAGFLGVLKTLWARGQGERIVFTIDIHTSRYGAENIITAIRWDYEF